LIFFGQPNYQLETGRVWREWESIKLISHPHPLSEVVLDHMIMCVPVLRWWNEENISLEQVADLLMRTCSFSFSFFPIYFTVRAWYDSQRMYVLLVSVVNWLNYSASCKVMPFSIIASVHFSHCNFYTIRSPRQRWLPFYIYFLFLHFQMSDNILKSSPFFWWGMEQYKINTFNAYLNYIHLFSVLPKKNIPMHLVTIRKKD
jgi:hypothetical protein